MQRRFNLLFGSDWSYVVPEGDTVVLQRPGGEPISQTATNGPVTFEGLEQGTYYIGYKPAGCPMVRDGILVVKGLVDSTRESLIAEIDSLTERVNAAEAIQHSVTDPGGISVQRAQLRTLRAARANAELRLREYDRRAIGRMPMVMT